MHRSTLIGSAVARRVSRAVVKPKPPNPPASEIEPDQASGLYLVCAVEMCERLGSAMVFCLLVLYLNEYLGLIEGAIMDPFQKAGVQLEADVQPGLPAILVDSSKFKELLMELLKNAAEAAQKGGGRCALKICGPGVITPAEQRRVDVLVSNTGSQIPPEKIQEVFRPFHGSKNSNHLGLGLTIAAMLSHQMNIQLGVASENNTTTFWLSCPMAWVPRRAPRWSRACPQA